MQSFITCIAHLVTFLEIILIAYCMLYVLALGGIPYCIILYVIDIDVSAVLIISVLSVLLLIFVLSVTALLIMHQFKTQKYYGKKSVIV